MEIEYSIVVSGKKDLHYFKTIKGRCFEVIQIRTSRHLSVWASRRAGFLKSRGPVVFFFDEDVMCPETNVMLTWTERFKHSTYSCWGGHYINPPQPSSGLQSYNRLCELWSETRSVFLGGLFALKSTPLIREHFKNLPVEQPWGGEDLTLSDSLNKINISIDFPDFFRAEHYADTSFSNCIRRAWTHGVRKWEMRTLNTAWRWPKLYWNDFKHVPFFSIHFGILAVGFVCTSFNHTVVHTIFAILSKPRTSPQK